LGTDIVAKLEAGDIWRKKKQKGDRDESKLRRCTPRRINVARQNPQDTFATVSATSGRPPNVSRSDGPSFGQARFAVAVDKVLECLFVRNGSDSIQ
jgi:hypothetical protein